MIFHKTHDFVNRRHADVIWQIKLWQKWGQIGIIYHFWGQSGLISCNKCISNACKTTSWAEIRTFKAEILICSKRSTTSATSLPPQQPNTVETSAWNEFTNYITVPQSFWEAFASHWVSFTSKNWTQDVWIHLLTDLWPILVQPQWNGQSRTGLRPYPKSCDHEFTGWWVIFIQEKQKQKKYIPPNGCILTGCSVLYLVLAKRPHLQ